MYGKNPPCAHPFIPVGVNDLHFGTTPSPAGRTFWIVLAFGRRARVIGETRARVGLHAARQPAETLSGSQRPSLPPGATVKRYSGRLA